MFKSEKVTHTRKKIVHEILNERKNVHYYEQNPAETDMAHMVRTTIKFHMPLKTVK